MALTLNKEVWKLQAVVFAALTVLFTIFFFFRRISIVLVVGVVLIIVTQKLSANYHRRMAHYNLSPFQRKIIGYVLLIVWLVVGWFILSNSIEQLGDAIGEINQQGAGTVVMKAFKTVQPFVPQIISDQVNILTIQEFQKKMISQLTILFQQVSVLAFMALLLIPLMFYMYFRRRKKIMEHIGDLIPQKFHAGFIHGARSIGSQLHDYLEGKIIESIVVGSICCLGFFIAGLKGWLILGFVAGFLNIVPFIGPVLGAIPPIIISFTDEPIVALYVILTVVIAQLVDNFYLIPWMISGKVKIDPLIAIVLILTGSQLLGMMGMIFAIPVYLVYKITLQRTYQELCKIYKVKE